MQDPLESATYFDFLRRKIDSAKGQSAYKKHLAESAGCQPSYLSQVISERAHFTIEHALGLAVFWELDEFQTTCWLTLVQHGRAGTVAAREYFSRQLGELKRKSYSLKERFQKDLPALESSLSSLYYSSWEYAAIHLAVMLPQLNNEQDLAKYFNLPTPRVRQILTELEAMRLIEACSDVESSSDNADGKENIKSASSGWRIINNSVHASIDTVFGFCHLRNWRQYVVHRQFYATSSDTHYSALHTLSMDDFAAIREQLLTLMDRSRKIVQDSPEEVLACLNIDWFKVSAKA